MMIQHNIILPLYFCQRVNSTSDSQSAMQTIIATIALPTTITTETRTTTTTTTTRAFFYKTIINPKLTCRFATALLFVSRSYSSLTSHTRTNPMNTDSDVVTDLLFSAFVSKKVVDWEGNKKQLSIFPTGLS